MMPWILLLLGILGLTLGAEGLVRGSAALARRVGLSPLVIGLTVVAFGTSAPELVVSLRAALAGNSGIALGNVVGSNIANIALILGVSSMIRSLGVNARVIRFDMPILLGTTLLLCGLLADARLDRWEGALLTAGAVAYTLFTVRASRREPVAVQTTFDSGLPKGPGALLLDVLWMIGGLALLVAGARAMVAGAVEVAEMAALSETVIGLTIVAVGTSLPEFATSILAAARGETDIAVGNVVGSNIFNIMGILGLTSLIQPISSGGLSGLDLLAMVVTAILLLPLMRTGLRISRWEGGLLFLAYAGYVALLLR